MLLWNHLSLSVSLCLCSLQTGAWTTADMDAEHQTLRTRFSKVITWSSCYASTFTDCKSNFQNQTFSFDFHRHGGHHLLPGGPPAANESKVSCFWGVRTSPQVAVQHTHCMNVTRRQQKQNLRTDFDSGFGCCAKFYCVSVLQLHKLIPGWILSLHLRFKQYFKDESWSSFYVSI